MRRIARFMLSALAVTSLSVSACGGHTSPCCCVSGRTVVLPPTAVAPIASVSTDRECGAHDGGGTPQARHVDVSRQSAGSCRVQVVLVDGDTYTFTVEFARTSANAACESPLSAVDASSPVLIEAGPCHGSGGGTAGTTGAAGASGTDAGMIVPSCAGLTTVAGPEPIRGCECMAADPQVCYAPCGPEGLGVHSVVCWDGRYVERFVCGFDPAKDYSCYRIPIAAANRTCPTDTSGAYLTPQDSTACTVDQCVVCNSYGGLPSGLYIDRGGATMGGYCVCQRQDSAGSRSWSCASDWAWPCPESSGC
jgi:hypothetical protein